VFVLVDRSAVDEVLKTKLAASDHRYRRYARPTIRVIASDDGGKASRVSCARAEAWLFGRRVSVLASANGAGRRQLWNFMEPGWSTQFAAGQGAAERWHRFGPSKAKIARASRRWPGHRIDGHL